MLVKENNPKPMDVVKAAVNLIGDAVTYNQGYRGIKTKRKMNLHDESF
jgi:hypothetical protein